MRNQKDLGLRKAAFWARMRQYEGLGFNRFAAADFVIGMGGGLSGPALDVGTGKGLTAQALARRGLDVVSVDLDGDEQSLARLLAAEAHLGDRVRFVRGDAAALPFAADHFGCAVVVDLLHHLDKPEPALEEAARVLRPAGTLILADFSAEGLELVARVHREEGREHPVSAASPDSAAAYLSRKGLDVAVRSSGRRHDVIALVKRR